MIAFAALPLPLPPVAFPGAHHDDPRESAPNRHPGRAGTVLVVEDEPFVCELAAEALLDEGYRVLTAADAHEAEAILAGESVDLLFTDIDLARNTNGIALAHRARDVRPDLAVVYTSGGRDHLTATEAVAHSVFVPKPYLPSRLVALTNGILRPASHHG